jgi:indolepyruvate decarboxylase
LKQVLWGSIGWPTPAAFGVALADQGSRTVLITGEGSHQLTANDVDAMGLIADGKGSCAGAAALPL